MVTTFHLSSAQDVNIEILEAIKAAFKSKPITIIVEEDEADSELSAEMKNILEERLQEGTNIHKQRRLIKTSQKKYGL